MEKGFQSRSPFVVSGMGLVSFYFWMDKPYNLFPSMHLAASFFSAFYCMRKGFIIGWTTMVMAIIVGVSVVLLKQHYIMDVVAGFFVAWICSFCSFSRVDAFFRQPGGRA